MPKFNRRRFLQIASAASFAPALPPISAGHIAAPAARAPAQLLWAGMYKNAGTPNVVGIAQTMGINISTMHSVYTKLVQTNVVAANSAIRFAQNARAVPAVMTKAPLTDTARPSSMKVDVVKFLTEDDLDEVDLDDAVSDEMLEEIAPTSQ
jgi:hypothetical protein